ncbi:hypothetical protein RBB50_003566 [Rhinocladiella similis]
MASIFTYQDEPPRIHSPWSTPGTSTPQPSQNVDTAVGERFQNKHDLTTPVVEKLEPERQDGPTEYKLHLLLRPRRKVASTETMATTSDLCSVSSHAPNRQTHSSGDSTLERPLGQPSGQARQLRLQQLTTQLLWRLQQSSPFHSSSNADLVLPVLPEAAQSSGVPERPSRLLPGLEESQGALYEIGVADDGTLVGLTDEELQESLGNLDTMATSLGCTTNVLRRVLVGPGGRVDPEIRSDKGCLQEDDLWVAEVLVFPDSRTRMGLNEPVTALDSGASFTEDTDHHRVVDGASTEQLRVTLVGAASSGKSTLLGTISTSTLDNGRGKSRLSLLKHRHEIASGVTSSVAQELVGYQTDRACQKPVVNYASGNVSSWTDIHNLADRLVFLSDSPGLPRFAKSTFRSLISWKPSWTVLCVAADDHEGTTSQFGETATANINYADHRGAKQVDFSLCHIDLCLRLDLPLIIVITKMDLANKTGLRSVLTKLLSALKASGKVPVVVGNSLGAVVAPEAGGFAPDLQFVSDQDQAEADRLVASLGDGNSGTKVPILMTSAVTGQGIAKIHALLRSVPITTSKDRVSSRPHTVPGIETVFLVDEVFSIPPSRVYTLDTHVGHKNQGVVLCGLVSQGKVFVGDVLSLGPFAIDQEPNPPQASKPMLKSKSYSTEASSIPKGAGIVARSYQESPRMSPSATQLIPVYVRVRVASLRSLRLPVTRMCQGETGTIGVVPVDDQQDLVDLQKARKGMVLVDAQERPSGYRSFSATFLSTDFANPDLPPLILGGHAIVYVNSVRAAVKIMTMATNEQDQRDAFETPQQEAEMFSFDGDDAVESSERFVSDEEPKVIEISFKFVSTVEWMNLGDSVLVVPTVSAPGPVTGAAAPNPSGLAGFVGMISEVSS